MPVLPNTWVLKLRDMRRKSQKQQQPPAAEAIDQVQGSAGRESCPATTDHLAGGDPMSFVRTALRTSRQSKQSPIRVFSSPVSWHGSTDNLHGVVEPRCKSPVNHKVFDIPYPNASLGKNLMRTPSPRRSTAASSMKTPTLLKAASKRDQDPLAFGRREDDPQAVESSLQSSAKPPLMIRSSAPAASNFSSSPGQDSEDGLDFTTAPMKVAALSTGAFRKTAQSRVQRNSSTTAPRAGRTRHGSLDMDSLEVSGFALDRALKEFNSMGVTGLKLAAKSSSRGDRKESKPPPAQEKKIQDEWTEELSRGALVKQQLFLKKRAALKLQLDDIQSSKQLELRSLSAMQQSWDSEDNDLQAGILVMQEPPHTQSKLLTLPSCLTFGWDNADDDDPQTVFDPDDDPQTVFDPDDSIECTRRKLLDKFNDDDDDDDSSSFALLHQAAEEAAASCWGSFSSSLPSDESIFTSSYNLAGDVKDSFPKKSFCSTSSDSSGITSTSGEFEEDLVQHWNAATSDVLSSYDMSSAASRFENRKAAKLFRAASCRLSREKSPRFLEEAAEAIQLESCFDSDVTEERLSDSERPGVPGNRIERFDSPGSFKSSTISSRDLNRFNMISRAAVCEQKALAKKTWVVPVHKRQGKSVGSSCDLRTRGTSHIMRLNSSAAALSAADHEATPVSSSAATARKHPARSRAKRLYEINSQLETARRKKSASRRKSNNLCHRELTRSKSQSADHSYLKTASLAADPVQVKSEAMSKSETWVSHKQLETTAAAAAAVKTTNPNSSNGLPRLLQEQNNLDRKQQQEQQMLVHNRRSSYLQSRCKGEEEEEEDLVTMPEELNGVVKESVALVKSSYNPYNDFKESMIEMIVEKDIQESRDLEELLQCYLSLNAVEYHALIVEVFTEVWCEIFERLQP